MNKLLKGTIIFSLTMLFLSIPASALAQSPPPPETRTFEGDQLILGDSFELQENQTLDGDLFVLGGNVNLNSGSLVRGSILLLGGNVAASGEITGSVITLGANVTFVDTTIIRGDVVHAGGYISGTDVASIYGEITHAQPRTILFDADTWRSQFNVDTNPSTIARTTIRHIFSNILQIIGLAILAVILLLIMPKPFKNAATSIANQPLLSGAAGLLTFLVLPIVVIILAILMITVILIPITLTGYLFIALAMLFGWIAAGYELGKRIASLFKSEWAPPVSAGIGTLILGTMVWLLGYVFCLGGLIGFIAACLGLGGVILSRFGTQEYPKTAIPGKSSAKRSIATEEKSVIMSQPSDEMEAPESQENPPDFQEGSPEQPQE